MPERPALKLLATTINPRTSNDRSVVVRRLRLLKVAQHHLTRWLGKRDQNENDLDQNQGHYDDHDINHKNKSKNKKQKDKGGGDREKMAKLNSLKQQDGSAGRRQSVGNCAADEERDSAGNRCTTISEHRNVSDPLPLPLPTTAHLPQFPQQQLQQQQHDPEPSCPQSPAEHETSQQTPLELHR
ncbi:hypothetical protein BKA61DRAFT_574347 [Leptodontidium sp. MPI-SDFR-AT-0119]|nr:hypothetical protein BKA61DRAFT_574347 [Leptodontidium sp. MPI-SDFR-AT-0119]